MPTLQPGIPRTFQLAAGETLAVSTDSASICRVTQLFATPVADSLGTPIAVPASSAVTFGGQSGISRWLVDQIVGPSVVVVQNSAASVPDIGAPVDVCHLFGSGAPTAATGANQAQTASLYTDTTNAKLYINGGTKAVPSWKIVTSA